MKTFSEILNESENITIQQIKFRVHLYNPVDIDNKSVLHIKLDPLKIADVKKLKDEDLKMDVVEEFEKAWNKKWNLEIIYSTPLSKKYDTIIFKVYIVDLADFFLKKL